MLKMAVPSRRKRGRSKSRWLEVAREERGEGKISGGGSGKVEKNNVL